MSKLISEPVFRIGVAFSAVLSTISGLITDFFMPIAPYGYLVSSISGLLVLLTLLLFLFPVSNSYLKARFKDYWYFPTFLLLTLFTGLTLGFQLVSDSFDDGLIATTNAGSAVQKSLLNIENRLTSIDETSKKIEENTGKLKLETSGDPRKELQNMGIEFTDESLFQAIKSGDERAVRLFIEAKKPMPQSSWEASALVLATSKAAVNTLNMYYEARLVDLSYFETKSSHYEIFGTPAFSLFEKKFTKAVELHYQNSENLRSPLEKMNIDPLSVAIASRNEEFVRFLLQIGVKDRKYCALIANEKCLVSIDPASLSKDI